MKDKLKNIIVNELYWIILFLPLWWILGVEQFFWFFSVGIIFTQFIIYNRFKFTLNSVSLLFFLFLIIYGISFFSINDKIRYITYFRNLSTYLTAFMLIVIISNVFNKWWQIEKILKGISLVMLITSIVAILAFFFDFFRFEFNSIFGYFIPNSIAKTNYGSVIVSRNIGYYNWFILFGEYFRVSSLFLYSTMFSATLAITIPISLFLVKIKQGKARRFYYFSTIIMFLALLCTTGRISIIALLFSLFIFNLFSIKNYITRYVYILILLFICLLILLWLENSGLLYELFDILLYSRGEGSVNTRFAIYQQTLNGVLERPFFGWGTERDTFG